MHTFNAEAQSTFTVEFRPALRGWEFFRDLDLARLLRAYPDEFLHFPFPPVPIQRALAVLFSKLGSAPR